MQAKGRRKCSKKEILVYVVKCCWEVKKGKADQCLLGIIGDFGEKCLRGSGKTKSVVYVGFGLSGR